MLYPVAASNVDSRDELLEKYKMPWKYMNSRSKVYSNRLSRRGRDRMVVGLITTITISSITTKVVSSNPYI
jgi:hypothetical protein